MHVSTDAAVLALHLAGRHEEELATALRAREARPGEPGPLLSQIRALAALGRPAGIARCLDTAAGLPTRTGSHPGLLMQEAALELAAHGHSDAATGWFERSLNWYRARPASDRHLAWYRRELARACYLAGQWDEAERAASPPDFAPVPGDPPWYCDHGMLGAIAARRGDRRAAQSMADWLGALDRPDLLGRPRYWQACIVALLGDGSRAVDLLRQALAEGIPGGMHLHTDAHFAAIRDTPCFHRLLTPSV